MSLPDRQMAGGSKEVAVQYWLPGWRTLPPKKPERSVLNKDKMESDALIVL